MSNQVKFGFILEYVKDIETAKRFYVDVLGLEVERDSPAFIQFKNFAIGSDESMSGERVREVYWVVEDAEAAFKDLSQKGNICLPLKQMPFGKVFGLDDPDGQPQYMIEFSKNRPSRAVN